MSTPSLHLFGIRHHGPGSARSLRRALENLRPDCILIEGPPDAEEVLPLVLKKGMKPPVALLVYDPAQPREAVYYPFAAFSPEWQALQYGLSQKKVRVRFMDLPQWHQLGRVKSAAEDEAPAGEAPADRAIPAGAAPVGTDPVGADPAGVLPEGEAQPAAPREIRRDPLAYLAEAAGYGDSERWWEHMVEERQDGAEVFAAILEAMTALRDAGLDWHPSPAARLREQRREAYMRQTIRAALAEGFERVAVVCGAWHAPALTPLGTGESRSGKDGPTQDGPAQDGSADADAALLKDLPRIKTAATWVPWTHGRLTFASGYGAGIGSPGWYQHLWEQGARTPGAQAPGAPTPGAPTPGARKGEKAVPRAEAAGRDEPRPPGYFARRSAVHWMTRVARLLRGEDLDASSASVIESVRLAEMLAGMRGRPLPGLAELNEASLTVLCHGNDAPLRLIHDRLIVGQTLGEVPSDTPAVPLQRDLEAEQKRLKLKVSADFEDLALDLRKPNDLDKSRLLHRLALLGLPWGEARGGGGGKSTFHEDWRLRWEPEFVVVLIEKAVWGNTLLDAAAGFARHAADTAGALPALTGLLDAVILADLPAALEHLMARVQAEAAVAADVNHLMDALPALARTSRYGNVRKADTAAIARVIDGLVARIAIGLPGACAGLNDEAAAEMFTRINNTDYPISNLQNPEHVKAWQAALTLLADRPNLHGLLAGRATRLLLDKGAFPAEEAARRMGLFLSTAVDPPQAAAWVEGFLKGSGELLLGDEKLWGVVDEWVSALKPDTFQQLLPLLRRTFSTFDAPVRRRMGERVKQGKPNVSSRPATAAAAAGGHEALDVRRAEAALPVIAQLLGLGAKEPA